MKKKKRIYSIIVVLYECRTTIELANSNVVIIFGRRDIANRIILLAFSIIRSRFGCLANKRPRGVSAPNRVFCPQNQNENKKNPFNSRTFWLSFSFTFSFTRGWLNCNTAKKSDTLRVSCTRCGEVGNRRGTVAIENVSERFIRRGFQSQGFLHLVAQADRGESTILKTYASLGVGFCDLSKNP